MGAPARAAAAGAIIALAGCLGAPPEGTADERDGGDDAPARVHTIAYEFEEHSRFRFRATPERLLAEVGGPGGGWTGLYSFEGIATEDLGCMQIELGNDSGGVAGSTAQFRDLNL